MDSPVNEKVVAYAQSKLGQRVGNGECTTLAVAALRHAEARRPDPVQGVWGDELKSWRDVQPGDILQFENAVFVKQQVRGDGAIYTFTSSYPHHTAIVAKVGKRRQKPILVILHQNASVGEGDKDENDKKLVKEWTLDMGTMRRGTVRVYRPVPALDSPVASP